MNMVLPTLTRNCLDIMLAIGIGNSVCEGLRLVDGLWKGILVSKLLIMIKTFLVTESLVLTPGV